MLTTAVLAYLVSSLLAPFLFLDAHMYPVCWPCGNNLNSKRSQFRADTARCSMHGDFIVEKS